MSTAQVYALKDHLNSAERKSIARSEREKDVKEILWCAECQVEFPPEDFGRHPKPSHVVSVMYRCLSCDTDYDTHDSAFNCCAEDWIKR